MSAASRSPGQAAAARAAPPPRPPAPASAGEVEFRHGRRRYRLPLSTIAVDVTPSRDRLEHRHVSLVYRDTRNRTFAIAFVHAGPGPVAERLVSDLTVSTPSGVSRARPGASRCALVLSTGSADAVAGTGRCTGLTDFSGEGHAPDVTDIRFSARSSARR